MRLGWLCICSSPWIADDLNIPQRVRSVIPDGCRSCYGHCRADSGLDQPSPPDDECLAYYPDAAPHDLVAGSAPLAEIAIWGFFYLWRGCLPNSEAAFYFSGSTYTTLGYGD